MVTIQVPEVVQQKLDIFAYHRAEFEECFRFKQDMHGQKRFPSLSVRQIVYYVHALWLCECKDRWLSVYRNIRRYEGERCLTLLKNWQEGRSADIIAFLHHKLDTLPFADLTAQLEDTRAQRKDDALVCRLEYGRHVLLNRGINLMHVLDAIFALSEEDLIAEVQRACKLYRHTPAQIDAQLVEMTTPLYAYRPHPLLVQRNMMLMNQLGIDVVSAPATKPSCIHPWQFTDAPRSPFAEQVIDGYLQMLAPAFNNVRGVRFVDRAEVERV